MTSQIKNFRRQFCRGAGAALIGAVLMSQAANAQTSTTPPGRVAMRAAAAGPVPGAIVCRDVQTVTFMFRWYADHWTDIQQDFFTNGQSRLLRGEPISSPMLDRYGCVLIPAGAPVMLEPDSMVPVIVATLPDGRTIRGTTLPSMIGPP